MFAISLHGLTLPARVEFLPQYEIRARYEQRSNRDFDSTRSDLRKDTSIRFRPGVTAKFGKEWEATLQYQFAYNEISAKPPIADLRMSDLSLGFMQHSSNGNRIRVGRQRINIGSERLIGQLDWSHSGRSFDGARFETKFVDLFAAKVGLFSPRPKNDLLAGANVKTRYGSTLLAYRHSETSNGDRDIWCFSHSNLHKYKDWLFDYDGAIQFGRANGKAHQAWALHAKVQYNFSPRTQIYTEFNAASGGSRANRSMTFDNLYPANHKFYGTMDLQGWRNMNEVVVGIDHTFTKRLTAKASWHIFSLRDPKDAWYGASGNPNARVGGVFVDPTGTFGRDVGQEVDLDATYSFDQRTTIQGGVSLFLPGTFVKRIGNVSDRQMWAFVTLNFKL